MSFESTRPESKSTSATMPPPTDPLRNALGEEGLNMYVTPTPVTPTRSYRMLLLQATWFE